MRLTDRSQPNTWQEACTKELVACAARLDSAAKAWAIRKRELQLKKRVIIADGDFASANLEGFDFSYCYIIRVNFSKAILKKANFRRAILRETAFNGAHIEGADFDHADSSGAMLADVVFDKTTKLNLAGSLASTNQARPALRRAIEEQQLLADLKRLNAGFWIRVWNVSTNYGTSIGRLFLVSIAMNVLFGTMYYALGWLDPTMFVPAAQLSWPSMVVLALQQFLVADTVIAPGNLFVALAFVLNNFLGFTVLGVFVALLSKNLVATLK